MSVHPRTRWLLGGCGCALVALLIGGAALLWYLWPSPVPPARPARAVQSRHAQPFFAEEDREVPTAGRTVYSGRLEPGRDATIRCDSTLTLTVPAGAFARAEPVTVKAATVRSHTPAAIATPLATYEVTIGAGGSLSRSVALTFTHAPVAETGRLAAARWDPGERAWVLLRLTRRSATTSTVESDHLSFFTLGLLDPNPWVSRRSEDGTVTAYVNKYEVPDPRSLFERTDGSRGTQTKRMIDALDEGGYVDPSQPSRQRYTDGGARCALYAKVVAEMAARIRGTYDRGDYKAPGTLTIYVSDSFSGPRYTPAWSGAYIGLPATGPKATIPPEELAFNLAHEIFHACQNVGLSMTWMARSRWLMEATAEYAAGRVAWADLDRRPFGVAGVVIDHGVLRGQMGDKLDRTFIGQQLTSVESEHAYESSHFLEHLFGSTPKLAGLPTLWHLTMNAGNLDRSEQVLEAYGRYAEIPLDELWSDFVAFLLLDKASPATGGLKGPQFLRQAEPSWSGPLVLPAPYTGTHATFTLGAQPGQPETASVKLTLEPQGGGARVVVFRLADGRLLDLQRDLPADRVYVSGKPEVLTVPLKTHELAVVVASRGDGADPHLTLRAELTTLAVTARWRHDSTLRLEVQAPATPQGPSAYRWDTGDPAASGPIETPTNTLDHRYSRPGEHEVRVRLLEGTKRELAGEAIGRVSVPSALEITILNDKTGRPVGSASVRLRHDGTTHAWGTDPSGVGRAENVPPRTVSFSIEVSAEGYEPFAKTSAIDMSKDVVVSKWVRLTPRPPQPRVAPTSPPRPPAVPSEPRSRPEPTEAPIPTPKATPETSNYDACMAPYRARLDEARAHNRAQNPDSQSITTKVVGVDAGCSAAYSACLAAVKERGRTCPVGPDGTFSQCFAIANRGWLVCANEEIDCSERALDAQCRSK